jgi:hypothetical protein
MEKNSNGKQSWISPLLTKLDLVQANVELIDFRPCWAHLEECRLPERMRKIVADVNGAAGYHVLELLDFLPPQKTVLRVSYSEQRNEHVMQIVVRENGAGVIFYSIRKTRDMWERYFPNRSRKGSRMTVLDLDLHPMEILEEDIQNWISYLLSGFEKKFKPHAKQQLSESSDLRMSAAVGKASA